MIAADFVECLDWNLIVSLFEYYCSSKFFKQRSWWSPAIWKDAFFAAAEIFEKDEALCKWESLESDLSRVWNLGEVDVAIIGAGPGGTLMAYLLAEQHGKSGAQTSELNAFSWLSAKHPFTQEGLPHWSHAIQEVAQ